MGGKTPEYEISLISGIEVVRNLNKNKYLILPVVISRDGKKWYKVQTKELLKLQNLLEFHEGKKDILTTINERKSFYLDDLIKKRIDVVFIAMHGPFREDGSIQGLLQTLGIKYTGPGVLASAIGMDKVVFKQIMRQHSIKVPRNVVVRSEKKFINLKREVGGYPYIVKPRDQGSSVGVSLAFNKKDLVVGLKNAIKYSSEVIIKEYIKGVELTCGVLGNDKPEALPLVEIRPKKANFFDFESKYLEKGSEEIVPAEISKSITKRIQSIALEVYKAINSSGFSRVDFLLRKDKVPFVLEINTIPGLTPMSLMPKAAKAAGYSYKKLLDKIISFAN